MEEHQIAFTEPFAPPQALEPTQAEAGSGQPRYLQAHRQQIEMRLAALDSLIPEDHKVRIIWAMVQEYDLSPLYAQIQAVEGEAGRPAIDPQILMALWLYATTEGVGSAREVARLCEEHLAYQWLVGGVSVNYHTLADFRVAHEQVLDRLLTEQVAALLEAGVVSLETTAQDGVRVRAHAGRSSFRREARLQSFLADAQQAVQALKESPDPDSSPAPQNRRRLAAQKRVQEERLRRVKQALKEIQAVKAVKERSHKAKAKRKEARCSTTDPEARLMKMADGGFRPAYNGEWAVDVGSGIVVGVDALQEPDQGQMLPMLEQIEARYQRQPQQHLVDGGFLTPADLDAAAAKQILVYAPIPAKEPAAPSQHPHRPYSQLESPNVQALRERMESAEGKALYQKRCASIEWVNALARNRGLQQFVVRGRQKVRSVLLWFALVHNLWVVNRIRHQAAMGLAG